MFNYVGHGAWNRLATEGILTSADVASLTNAPRLPVVAMMTCTANRFDYPGYEYLGEALLNRTGGGAVAVWGPTGLSLNDPATELDKAFMAAWCQPGTVRLGDAIRQAAAAHAAQGGMRFDRDIYVLLGDPALKMK